MINLHKNPVQNFHKKINTAFLGIGTNKGNREKNIDHAIKLLGFNKDIKIIKVSKLLKNPPQEGIKNGYFLNGAIKVRTSLDPIELLNYCKKTEVRLGRRNKIKKNNHAKKINKPRIIDLDLLFYENKIIETDELQIPHLRLHKRYFVMIPLLELEPEFIHPVFKKSLKKLYFELLSKEKLYA
ncbi:MAG: 2-amino-4-hydroxy-6-hydroxymethyldihydropteridine diphosphokinase [Candidatus Melainabacteria bacterium RIFCSPHIGHO2_02_FULL_34_12]|nr:MAG: 2-amino-4-hydroxy-6-hydroxymethyldihydropteridine diphosphokinase [Candidatus Melainabacteria bacterium RIFCSPHIGHO2_02_FULL_34_12]